MTNAWTESHSLRSRASNQLHTNRLSDGRQWTDGCLLFPEGMVAVMIDPHIKPNGYTRFDAVVNGRQYIRTEYRALSRRGVVTVARRWLRKVLAEG